MSVISTALEIANMALGLLGQKAITAIDTTTENGRKVNTFFSLAVNTALRDVKPNFAKTRAIFHHTITGSELSISGVTAADPVVITSAAHGLSNGDTIAIWDVAGMTELNGKRYIVANVTTDTFELQDENENDIDGEDYTAYSSGGKFGLVADTPTYDYTYRYTIPSDYVIIMELNGNEDLSLDHSIESGEILTDEPTLKGMYIKSITDYTLFDPDFIEICAYKLAAILAYPITTIKTNADYFEEEYEKKKAQAKGQKSQESGTRTGPPRTPVINQVINSRGAI